jgi:hypothetical protein
MSRKPRDRLPLPEAEPEAPVDYRTPEQQAADEIEYIYPRWRVQMNQPGAWGAIRLEALTPDEEDAGLTRVLERPTAEALLAAVGTHELTALIHHLERPGGAQRRKAPPGVACPLPSVWIWVSSRPGSGQATSTPVREEITRCTGAWPWP